MDTPQNQSHSSHRICGCFLCRLIKYFWNCGCFLCRLPKYFWNCGCFLCRLPKYFWQCGCFLCKYFWNCGCLLCRLTKYFWNCGCFLYSLTKYFWNCGCFLCILTEYFWNCSRSRSRSRSRAIEGTGISSPSAIEGIQTSPIDANEAAKDDFDADHLKSLAGLPTNFSFQTLETATGSFSKEIGRGGFGKVYEGILTDGTQVAVKCLLNQTGHGQREFCAEILTISGLNHSNLVSLRGMCVEGPHRILVYEFMPNGSLDKWLFASDIKLDWKTRYSIALDTARGLAYLHEDSIRGILHLDVKPQNILLDENFKAKVSDFGMARSLKRDLESRVVTAVRGTPGYMAPEWFVGWGITYKADVFSYGMVLLEIIRGSKNVDHSQDSENWYFPSVAFKKARQGKMDELIESGLKLKRPQEMDEAYRLIKTALWCIQSNSAMRPSMATVVRLLEGDIELMDPPLACTLPFAPSLDDDETPPDLDC